MDDLIPIENYSPEINELLALVIAILAGALIRLLRVQVGGILMLCSILFLIMIKPGWEKGVFIFDLSIMNKNTFLMFFLFVSAEWLVIGLSPQFKNLTGSLVDTVNNHKAAAILLPSLSPLVGTPRQGTSIIEESLQTKTPEDRFAFIAWFRHLLTPLLPCLMLPVVLAIGLNNSTPKDILIQLWPLFFIWLVSGAVLLKGFESMRVKSHPHFMPFLKVIGLPLIAVIPSVYGSPFQIVATMWAVVIVLLITDKEARKLLWSKRGEVQIIRWFLLAAGISVWTWMFDNLIFCTGKAPTGLSLEAIQNGVNSKSLHFQILQQLAAYKWITITALPFLVGLISGHALLTAMLVAPIALSTGLGINALLPCVGCGFVGTVLSPEHISFIKLKNQYHGTLKNIYVKLLGPSLIAALLLALVLFIDA